MSVVKPFIYCKNKCNCILLLYHRSSQVFLKDDDRQIVALDQEKIKEETITLLKKYCQCDVGTNYKLGKAHIFNYKKAK